MRKMFVRSAGCKPCDTADCKSALLRRQQRRTRDFWSLELGVSLELGYWGLVLRCPEYWQRHGLSWGAPDWISGYAKSPFATSPSLTIFTGRVPAISVFS